MELFRLIEQSAPMVWMRECGSLLGYPLILFLHTLGLGTVAGVSGAIGLRVLGFGRGIPLRALAPVFRLIWWAFILSAISGLFLFFADATTKLASPIFYVKMAFVAAAMVCGSRLRKALESSSAATAPGRGLALASLACWAAAITAGRLIAYIGPVRGPG